MKTTAASLVALPLPLADLPAEVATWRGEAGEAVTADRLAITPCSWRIVFGDAT